MMISNFELLAKPQNNPDLDTSFRCALSDTDECCSTCSSPCQQLCVNTQGGYRCECNTGYHLGSDLSSCTGKQSASGAVLDVSWPVWVVSYMSCRLCG